MSKTLSVYKKIISLRKRFFQALSGHEELYTSLLDQAIPNQVEQSLQIDSLPPTSELSHPLQAVMQSIYQQAKAKELSLTTICSLHQQLYAKDSSKQAGQFRLALIPNKIGKHTPPLAAEVPNLLTKALQEYNANHHQNIINRLAHFHLAFGHTHPFESGNGLIGRALLNYLLVREGFVPINLLGQDQPKYYEAFNQYNRTGATTLMEELIGRSLTNSYHWALAHLEGQLTISLADYAKAHQTSHSNLINKAKRQSIDAFLENGVWMIAANSLISTV